MDTAGIAALGVIITTAIVLASAFAVYAVQRQDRRMRALREDAARDRRGIDRKVESANGEARALMAQALVSAERAAQAADRAERASDRSTIAGDLSAQRAQEAGDRAQEASLWARIAGAVRERPIELRDDGPEAGNDNDAQAARVASGQPLSPQRR